MVKRIITTHNEKYKTVEYKIDVDESMRKQAYQFSKDIILGKNQYERLVPTEYFGVSKDEEKRRELLEIEIQRTYAGKIGEIAFNELLKSNDIDYDISDMFTIYEGEENTDKFDFHLPDGSTIDIKTGFRDNHVRLLVNIQQFERDPKDYYVGVKLICNDIKDSKYLIDTESVSAAIIKGFADKSYLAKKNYEDFGEGSAKAIKYDKLLPIDFLVRSFKK